LLGKETASFIIEADVELSPTVVTAVNQQIREMRSTKSLDDGGPTDSQASGSSSKPRA